MEKEQIKNYLETLHAEYLDIANESINNYNNSGKDEQVMKDFYLKEATKYANKAEALLDVINFINN
jgi:hypothetical protein|tara:strand:+ start:449 stop:646 length:198 start_codon:yes stop_codon:yes gene_type:complete